MRRGCRPGCGTRGAGPDAGQSSGSLGRAGPGRAGTGSEGGDVADAVVVEAGGDEAQPGEEHREAHLAVCVCVCVCLCLCVCVCVCVRARGFCT